MPLWGSRSVDLTNVRAVTFALLADAGWKKRAVEEITVGSALSVESRRSFQCADIGEVLGRHRPRGATEASLLLPLTTLPKRPLLGFDVSAPDRTVANLPPRGALAEIEAAFVVSLAERAGIHVAPDLKILLTKVCEFSPGRWSRWMPDDPLPYRLRSFVEAATQWTLDPSLVERWLAEVTPAAEALRSAIGLPADALSSAENPLLVIPLAQDELGLDPADVLGLLTRYTSFVMRCTALTDPDPFPPHAVLADYGRWWEVMIECTVPLDGPFIVRMGELRPLDLTLRGRADIVVTTGDAISNHTVVRVVDENVNLRTRDLAAFAIDGTPLGDGEFDSVRVTREEVATYAAAPDREYRLVLRLRLGAAGPVTWTNAATLALTSLSIVLVVCRWSSLTDGALAVLVIPTTFAASLAVTRERTTLANRLTARWRVAILVLTVVLWTLVGAAYLTDTVATETPCEEPVTPRVFAEAQHVPTEPARRCDGEEHR